MQNFGLPVYPPHSYAIPAPFIDRLTLPDCIWVLNKEVLNIVSVQKWKEKAAGATQKAWTYKYKNMVLKAKVPADFRPYFPTEVTHRFNIPDIHWKPNQALFPENNPHSSITLCPHLLPTPEMGREI